MSPSPSTSPSTLTRDRAPLDRATRARIVREAITLPLIFLTVTFGGGLRISAANHQLVFLPPSLMALVLALLLLGALVRTGTLIPDQLMHPERPPLANLSGLLVVITLFAAAAQVFNTTTPETGLLQFIVNLFFLLLLWNTVAAQPDRRRMISSLIVIVGGAFVVKYVVLAALYDPAGGLTKRVLMTMLEGVTLGGLVYQSPAPATGYVAFFTVLLFLIGVTLLPQRPVPLPRALQQQTVPPEPSAAALVVQDPDDR
jgi:drug/metabolite transporter (DMT)-like permease